MYQNPVDGSRKLVTVSRDSEAKIFSLDSDGFIDFHADHTFFLPTQISTVCVIDRSDLPTVLFIFGCLNGHQYVFHGLEQNASQCITLHQNNVCIIRADSTQTRIASGSWDHTTIVFKLDAQNQLIKMLKIVGHQESVMDVQFIRSDLLLTASSDRSIVLWNLNIVPGGSAQQQQAFQGHEDCVRGLLLSKHEDGFYSISNDQTVRYWNMNSGMCERTYVGHEHFIFNINRLTKEYFLTCGENNAIIIWNERQTTPWQSLKLPTVTIWSVLSTSSNVFYAAGSDGILYIFTNHVDRRPDDQSQMLFDEMLVKQTKIPFASVAHLKLYEENSLVTIPPRNDNERRLIRSIRKKIENVNHFPIFECKLWPSMKNLEAFRKKFEEFNSNVEDNLRLSPEYLQISSTEIQNPETICEELCIAFSKLINWPKDIKFIVYDLLRVLLTNKYFNTYFLHQMESKEFRPESEFFNSILRCNGDGNLSTQLTSLRVLANMFASVHGAEFMYRNFSYIQSNIVRWKDLVVNINVQMAYASIWFNYSVLLADHKKRQNHQFKQMIMEKIQEHDDELIESKTYQPLEADYHSVIIIMMNAFGNLIASKFNSQMADLYLKRLQQQYTKLFKDNSEIRYCLRQIEIID
ncbi:HD domain-containing protein 2 [Dermatophagoides farinae]|uniref:HD domain-containing protein 2 n=1 Tax=Dermatophagoides farinae TaxID=6954 RepID=A0A922LCK6_DERFA|nr:HD domain-containing protein 2 [Dermatophagoides farinae]